MAWLTRSIVPSRAGDDAADRRRLEGQPVAQGLAAQRALAFALALDLVVAGRDVADAADGQHALADVDQAGVDLHREARAVLATPHGLRGGELRRGVIRVGRDDEPERLPDHLVLLVAEEPLRRSVERLDQARLAGRHDAVGHVLQHRAGVDLAVAQRTVERRDGLQGALELARLHEEMDEGRDLGAQHVGEDRREDEVHRAAGIGGRRLGLVAAVGGEEDDRGARRLDALADELGRLVAVQDRHADVHEDDGEALLLDGEQGGAPGVDIDDGVAQGRQHRANGQALARVVVDDEHASRRRCVEQRQRHHQLIHLRGTG